MIKQIINKLIYKLIYKHIIHKRNYIVNDINYFF